LTYHKIIVHFNHIARLHIRDKTISGVFRKLRRRNFRDAEKIVLQRWKDSKTVYQLDITQRVKEFRILGDLNWISPER